MIIPLFRPDCQPRAPFRARAAEADFRRQTTLLLPEKFEETACPTPPTTGTPFPHPKHPHAMPPLPARERIWDVKYSIPYKQILKISSWNMHILKSDIKIGYYSALAQKRRYFICFIYKNYRKCRKPLAIPARGGYNTFGTEKPFLSFSSL